MTDVYQGTRHSAQQILGIDDEMNITGSVYIFCECL